MAATPNAPQAAFARFVRRAIDHAKDERGWTVTELAGHTGVGRSTLFRWLAGDWHTYPEMAKVRAFCVALDVPVAAAFRALGVPDNDQPESIVDARQSEPAIDADLQVIMSRLADPAVPAAEKQLIRDLLRYLARRPARRAG